MDSYPKYENMLKPKKCPYCDDFETNALAFLGHLKLMHSNEVNHWNNDKFSAVIEAIKWADIYQ